MGGSLPTRLLVVDDDRAFARFVRRAAEGCGFETMIGDAADWRQTVAVWQPAVIVLDLNMPGGDGVESLRQLAAEGCTAEIVLVSGVDPRTLLTAARLGRARNLTLVQSLHKPVRLAELQHALMAARERRGGVSPAEICDAIKTRQLFLQFQPKLDCRTDRIIAAEALVRWRHPRHGIIPPEQFLPVADAANMMDELTDWVIGEAARAAAAWQGQGAALGVAVNISGKNLHDIDLPDRIAEHCHNCSIGPDRLVLELTETHAIGNAVRAMDIMTRLRIKGFELSIDDFGTGYSSLVQLQRLPFSELKIDRSFVSDVTTRDEAKKICEVIVVLAHKLGLKCVAEGVETADTLAAMRILECDVAQGNYICPAISPDSIVEFAQAYAAARRENVDDLDGVIR